MARSTEAPPADVADILPPTVRSARIAASTAFLALGFTFAVWAVHIPLIVSRLGIDPSVLGLALLAVGLGGVISQPITGWLVGRIGSRKATILFLPACIVAVLVPIASQTVAMLFAGTFLLGLAAGAANVAINTQASEIETLRRRPTMSSFHGFFSVGALIGSVVGAVVVGAGFGDGRGASALVVLLIVVVGIASRSLLVVPQSPSAASASDRRDRRRVLSAALLALAALVFLSNMVEGSVTDWSALYLVTARNFSDAQAASGFALFQLVMAACRLAGSVAVERLGEQRVVVWGGILICLGMLLVVVAPWPWLSPAGFAVVALGAANTIPVLIGVASRVSAVSPAAGVATAATGALLGFVIGPPVIGFIANELGLPVALGCLSIAGAVVAAGAALFAWPSLGRGATRTTAS